jgi:hypothetical protein
MHSRTCASWMKRFSLFSWSEPTNGVVGPKAYIGYALVAAAIAAFRETNDARHLSSSPPKFDKITSPAIIMEFGTLPMFYKICISQQFCDVVSLSRTDLSTSMTVYCHYPQVDSFRHLADGMMRLETRRELLRYMEAFPQLIMSGEMVSVK